MTECINCDSLTAELCITYSTVNYVIVRSVYRTGRSFIVFNNYFSVGMTECINCDSLTAELCVTYGTVNYVIIRSVYGTGRSYIVLNYCATLGVTKSIHNFLCNENHVTYRTVTSLGKTGCSTSGSLSCINNRSVSKCINYDSLTAELCTTYCTVNYVIVRSVYSTGRSYVVLNYCATLGVTKCVHNFLCNENYVTYRTVTSLGKTGCGTSRSYCCIYYCLVSLCCSFVISITVTAVGTCIGGIALFGTCGCCYYRAV